jgi:hypothetical protein
VTLTRGFWFADLESGDGFGGRAAGLGQLLVAVVDAEGMAGGLDGQGSSSVDDSDVNALPCNGYGAAAADPGVRPGRVRLLVGVVVRRGDGARTRPSPAAATRTPSVGRASASGWSASG